MTEILFFLFSGHKLRERKRETARCQYFGALSYGVLCTNQHIKCVFVEIWSLATKHKNIWTKELTEDILFLCSFIYKTDPMKE